MGRRKRYHQPGAVYHAYSRGNDGAVVFHDDDDRSLFLAILADVSRKTRCRILAYCLMSNHFHLLLEIAMAPLAMVMQRVLGRYSRAINRKYGKTGHVFEARYKTKVCRGDRYYQKLLPYIHRNPEKAGMVQNATDWLWSSAHQFEGKIRSSLVDVDRALSFLAAEPEEARRIYSVSTKEHDEDFEPEYDLEEDFRHWRSSPEAKVPRPLKDLAKATEIEFGIDLRETKFRPAGLRQGRRAFALRALAEGYRAAAVAEFLGITRSGVSRTLQG